MHFINNNINFSNLNKNKPTVVGVFSFMQINVHFVRLEYDEIFETGH